MGNPVTITVGLVSTAVKAGLNGIRKQFSELRKFANSSLSEMFVGAGLVASIGKIIEKAGQLADMSQKFGVTAEALQEITNAAQPNGASMEDVGSALNKTALSQEKVRKGNEELRASLKSLGVDARDFVQASPIDAFYMIADAVAKADDRTAAYGAVVDLCGKKAGVLFTTMEAGSEDIKAQGQAWGVFSNEAVKAIDDADDEIHRLLSQLQAWGAEALNFVSKVMGSIGAIVASMVQATSNSLDGLVYMIHKLIEGDFKQAAKGFHEIFDSFSNDDVNDNLSDSLKEIWSGKAEPPKNQKRTIDLDDTEKELAAKKEIVKLQEDINKKEKENAVAELDGQAKINELIFQRDQLQEKLDLSWNNDQKDDLETQMKLLDVTKELVTAQRAYADALEQKQKSYDEAEFQSKLENAKTNKDKLKMLNDRRDQELDAAESSDDQRDQLDHLTEAQKLMKQINDINKQPDKIAVGSLGQIGGGGNAYANGQQQIQLRTAKATEQVAKQMDKSVKTLEDIAKKLDKPATWR